MRLGLSVIPAIPLRKRLLYSLALDSLNYKFIWDDAKFIRWKLISLLPQSTNGESWEWRLIAGRWTERINLFDRILSLSDGFHGNSMETKYKNHKVVLPTNNEPACYNFRQITISRPHIHGMLGNGDRFKGVISSFFENWCFDAIHDDSNILRGVVF